MANLVINGTIFAPFSTSFTGVVPGTGTYHAEGGEWGNAPSIGCNWRELEQVTFNDVAGTGIRDRGFRYRPVYCTVLFSGTVASVHTAYKNFLDGMHGSGDTIAARFTIALPDGASLDGCMLAAPPAEPNWGQLTGKVLLRVSLMFHQLSTTN